MSKSMRWFDPGDRAATAVEYGIMIAAIAAVVIAVALAIGQKVKSSQFEVLNNLLDSVLG